MRKKFLEIAKFEFLKVVRKPSFWLATLFLPLFIGLVSYISGYSSIDAAKKMENLDGFSKLYVYDSKNIIAPNILIPPFEKVIDIEGSKNLVKNDVNSALVVLSDNFYTDLKYEMYYREDGDFMRSATLPTVVNAIVKQGAIESADPQLRSLLKTDPSGLSYTFDETGKLKQEGFEKFILPIISLVVFFMAVYISSSFLLQSVSAEKENRMIETILSIVDKKSLMFGKMVGLMGVMFVQLFTWFLFGFLAYKLVMGNMNIPIPINFENIDFSMLPLNIFLTIMGFLFFAAIMTGTGAIGAGAEDSKNLSSIFIILSVFPMYLMQILITDPDSLLARIFSYFPFTSFMVLLVRNSFGALSLFELILGIVLSILYVLIAMYVAVKLFELGCLMYNRRPSLKELLRYLK